MESLLVQAQRVVIARIVLLVSIVLHMLKQRRHAQIAQWASVNLIQQYALHVTKGSIKMHRVEQLASTVNQVKHNPNRAKQTVLSVAVENTSQL